MGHLITLLLFWICFWDQFALELKITRETYEEFSERVIRTIKNMPVDVVDKIIESMDNRISLVIKF